MEAASSQKLTAALAKGGAEDREHSYATIEGAVRSAASSSSNEQAISLSVACVGPLIESVLCAPASRIGEAEYLRASVLLYDMCKLDTPMVSAETLRKDADGVIPMIKILTTPGTVLSVSLAKDPNEWTRSDAILAAVSAGWMPMWALGGTAVFTAAGIDEMEILDRFSTTAPYFGEQPQPADRYVPLALLLLDLVRSEVDSQPEGVIAGAGQCMCWMLMSRPPMAKALWKAGFLEIFEATMWKYSPMEMVGRQNLIPSGLLFVLKDLVEGAQVAGIEVIQPLLDSGAVDIAISVLTAYKMLGKPEAASVAAIQWGALFVLEVLVSSAEAEPVVAKLRSAGVESFRYLLDHPLVLLGLLGQETGVFATTIAALVWGRDDDGGGLIFQQQDIDQILQLKDHRGDKAGLWPMKADHGKTILNLAVSDMNKELLLKCKGFIPLLVDSLLLDPEHPRMENTTMMGTTDWERVKAPVQRDFTEAIAQLAMFPPGREALLQDSTVAEALQQVAVVGWTTESQAFAQSALLALSGRQPDATQTIHDHAQPHLMVSYQWDVQDVVKRIVNELQVRGYIIWFDLHNMKGSTVDSMSEAVENSAVMLSCISRAYKESSNCRLEMQYGHQQEVDLIPMMMEDGYKPTGWLGLLIGTRLYFNFHPAAIETDAAFLQQIDAVVRELGERGKPKTSPRVSEGVPHGSRSQTPIRAPAPVAAIDSNGFTPSMQSSPSLVARQPSTTDASMLVEVMLEQQRLAREHEETLRQEAKAEKTEMELKMETLRQQMEALREEMKPAQAIAQHRLAALQARIEALHTAKLLGDDETCALEDMIADFIECKASLVGVVTLDTISGNENAVKLLKLITLSEHIVADAAFARQARRKYV